MSALDRVTAIISRASPPGLNLQRTESQRINPKWSMVTRVFVNMLSEEEIVPRLTTAQTAAELKAVLFVDQYLSRMRNGRFRHHIRTLLANPDVPLSVIEWYAALSFAREAIWQQESQTNSLEEQVLYSVEAAAVQLGLNPEALYQRIAAGNITAHLYLTWTEVVRLQEETP